MTPWIKGIDRIGGFRKKALNIDEKRATEREVKELTKALERLNALL